MEADEKELNKKLAEWAGFILWKGSLYWYPDNTGAKRLPTLTSSLDACFKWLEPKLEHYSVWHGAPRVTNQPPLGEHNAEVWIGHSYGYGHSKDSIALALCLAIEKLIDGGKNE